MRPEIELQRQQHASRGRRAEPPPQGPCTRAAPHRHGDDHGLQARRFRRRRAPRAARHGALLQLALHRLLQPFEVLCLPLPPPRRRDLGGGGAVGHGGGGRERGVVRGLRGDAGRRRRLVYLALAAALDDRLDGAVGGREPGRWRRGCCGGRLGSMCSARRMQNVCASRSKTKRRRRSGPHRLGSSCRSVSPASNAMSSPSSTIVLGVLGRREICERVARAL
jgi:hypothetical protein